MTFLYPLSFSGSFERQRMYQRAELEAQSKIEDMVCSKCAPCIFG
jgi:hypothetical protein